jgi:ATP-dependent 26S proteasome regulatory subunit
LLGGKRAIVRIGGVQYTAHVHHFVNPDLIDIDAEVFLSDSLGVIGVLKLKEEEENTLRASLLSHTPDDTFEDIGGLQPQIQETVESILWPLTKADEFEKFGIDPPKGVLLYGPPGCGKTMIARAVANIAQVNFFRLSASSLVQKYLGDGPKIVRWDPERGKLFKYT